MNRGRRGYPNFFNNIQVKTSGALMRLAVFGGHFPTVGLARKDLNVKGGRKLNRE